MKIQLTYKVTGENRNEIIEEMSKIVSSLKESGNEVYCPILDKENIKLNSKELIEKTFNKINEADAILALLKSKEKSEGMLLEIGYAIAKKKRIILAINKDIKNTRLKDLTYKIIEFDNIDSLCNKLKNKK